MRFLANHPCHEKSLIKKQNRATINWDRTHATKYNQYNLRLDGLVGLLDPNIWWHQDPNTFYTETMPMSRRESWRRSTTVLAQPQSKNAETKVTKGANSWELKGKSLKVTVKTIVKPMFYLTTLGNVNIMFSTSWSTYVPHLPKWLFPTRNSLWVSGRSFSSAKPETNRCAVFSFCTQLAAWQVPSPHPKWGRNWRKMVFLECTGLSRMDWIYSQCVAMNHGENEVLHRSVLEAAYFWPAQAEIYWKGLALEISQKHYFLLHEINLPKLTVPV